MVCASSGVRSFPLLCPPMCVFLLLPSLLPSLPPCSGVEVVWQGLVECRWGRHLCCLLCPQQKSLANVTETAIAALKGCKQPNLGVEGVEGLICVLTSRVHQHTPTHTNTHQHINAHQHTSTDIYTITCISTHIINKWGGCSSASTHTLHTTHTTNQNKPQHKHPHTPVMCCSHCL